MELIALCAFLANQVSQILGLCSSRSMIMVSAQHVRTAELAQHMIAPKVQRPAITILDVHVLRCLLAAHGKFPHPIG